MPTVLIFGTGLMGTSVGLALRAAGGFRVLLHDPDPGAQSGAVARGAGEAWDGRERGDLGLAAGPPTSIPATLRRFQRLMLVRTSTHLSSVQSQVQAEVETLGCELSSVVGGHPLAGGEGSGPDAASAGLFVGRPWALCPSVHSSAQALSDVTELVVACGAEPLLVGAQEHDEAVALLSHLPHVVASALAALLLVEPTEAGQERGIRTELSGPGLVDTTRLAAGSPTLWTQILAANAAHVAPVVRALAGLLDSLASDLELLPVSADAQARATALAGVTALLERGNEGRALVPLKRGVREAGFVRVGVEVDDSPGQLAAVLTTAGTAGINVEDVRVDHVPGRPRGTIELLVAPAMSERLRAALRAVGWAVVGDL